MQEEQYQRIINAWEHYLKREIDFLHAQSYLPLTKNNFSIYSPKLLDLIIVLGSDIESVFKIIGEIDTGKNLGSMEEYKKSVFSYIGDLPSKQFELYNSDIFVENPFEDWSKEKRLTLWDNYTDIKHYSESQNKNLDIQDLRKKYGTWEYALQFLSALFLLINVTCEKYISAEEHRNQYILKPFSQIFKYKYFGTVEPMNTTLEQIGGTLIIG